MTRPALFPALAAGAAILLGVAGTAAGQQAPPIAGVTGTVALEGTVDQEHAGANTIVVKTVDGVEHVFHFAKDLLVHGDKGTGVDALRGLRSGTTVVVHYTVAGNDASAKEIDRVDGAGLKVTEGVVTRVDRGRKQIAVRFDDGKTETFGLTDRAAVDAGRDIDATPTDPARVVMYYSDEAGKKVAHFFKRVS
jgi:hypothetical protein